MPHESLDQVQVLACDIFGTTVDWRTGVADQTATVFAECDLALDPGRFADAWRDRYLPSMARVNAGEQPWANLDALHRQSLNELLDEHGVADAVDEHARQRLVRAWHRLPAWDDAADGLARLRRRYVTAALSNGGFALLTHLVKAAGLPFDCIVSADHARAYKPAPASYRTAAELLDVNPAEVMMVAAHRWDLDGAHAAGLRTAFLHRPHEKGPNRTADAPNDITADLTATGFTELADTLNC